MATPFDVRRLQVTGPPTPLIDHGGVFSVSSNRVLVHAPAAGSSQLVWIDRQGNEIEELPLIGDFRYRRLSHDGRRLAAAVPDPETGLTDIWVYDLVRHEGTRITFHPTDEIGPVWSSDDDRLVFTSNRNGRFDIYEKASNGTGDEVLVYASDTSKGVGSWSRDMRHLIFNSDGDVEGELWSLTLPDLKPARLLRTPFLLWDGQISPDGRFVAYMSGETRDRLEVYVQPFPSGVRRRVSRAGGRWPRWGPDGRELFFVDDVSRTLMAMEVTAAGFEGVTPRPLFSLPSYLDPWYNTHDGQRFLFAKSVQEDSGAALTLVQNWPGLLRK